MGKARRNRNEMVRENAIKSYEFIIYRKLSLPTFSITTSHITHSGHITEGKYTKGWVRLVREARRNEKIGRENLSQSFGFIQWWTLHSLPILCLCSPHVSLAYCRGKHTKGWVMLAAKDRRKRKETAGKLITPFPSHP